MPSPFPGMDPFIESQRFDEFHNALVMVMKEELVPLVRPKYVIDVDRYVFLSSDDEQRLYRPDVAISAGDGATAHSPRTDVATLEPQILAIPASDEEGQTFLTIRLRDDHTVVTMIELLSPVNKEASQGQIEYLTKRANYLRSMSSIVEIDLLRGGVRLPTQPSLIDGDYLAFVIRGGDSSHVEGYSWKLADRLPVIPIPLAADDSDVGLDLQEAFNKLYDRHGYDYSLNYKTPVQPALSAEEQCWVDEQLAKIA